MRDRIGSLLVLGVVFAAGFAVGGLITGTEQSFLIVCSRCSVDTVMYRDLDPVGGVIGGLLAIGGTAALDRRLARRHRPEQRSG